MFDWYRFSADVFVKELEVVERKELSLVCKADDFRAE
jgi:hypothetical protein